MTNPKGFETSISDETILEKTKKTWNNWFAILDSWEAQKKDHKAIARYLSEQWAVSPWWSQTITVRYEQMRGLRKVGQRSDGKFAVSITRVLRATADDVWKAFSEPGMLSKWFTKDAQIDLRVGGKYSNSDGDFGEYLKIDKPRHLRFTWENPDHCPGTIVDISITEVPGNKIRVVLEHSKIEDQAGYEDMKSGWTKAMNSFKSFIETGKPIPF
jgi:uncharacterized protein YndB with AHSA1/START domain